MGRKFNYEIMEEIKERWSPRAFDEATVEKDELMAVLEAASYAPSCFNEQPWRFVVGYSEDKLEKLRGILTPSNQAWANRAPVLVLIASKKKFEHNNKNNRWHEFDAGTAWGFMSLEAQRRGLITHAMGGFDKEKAHREFNISDDYDLIAVVAIGRYGDKNSLSQDLQERENPAARKSLDELILDI